MKKKIDYGFLPRPIEMMETAAYRQLSLSAHRVLDRLEIALHKTAGKANGELRVTYLQFVQYGVRRNSIQPALNELVAAGMVEITRKGRSGNNEFRRATWYRLTYRDTAESRATHEWRQFKAVALKVA